VIVPGHRRRLEAWRRARLACATVEYGRARGGNVARAMQEAMPVRIAGIRRTAIAVVAVAGLVVGVAGPAAADPGHGAKIKVKIKGRHDHIVITHKGDLGRHGHLSHSATCTGTLDAPGVLAGTYHSSVVVNGVCFVNGGSATILGDLVVAPGAALNATFAMNDMPGGTGTSSLDVTGNVVVQRGGALFLGCEPNFSQCSDDSDQNGGTLTGQNHVGGNLIGFQALGLIVHATTVDGSVADLGGGGGVSCDPPAGTVFAALQSPAFTDFEDNTIGHDLAVVGVQSCWSGSLRNNVGGSLVSANNTMADPDAGEVLQNTIQHDVVCFGNSPAVQFGDSGASPNVVGGHASGECGFDVMSPDPNYPNMDGTGGPQPISVKAA